MIISKLILLLCSAALIYLAFQQYKLSRRMQKRNIVISGLFGEINQILNDMKQEKKK